MILEGSCHCGGVRFSVLSAHPYPFNYCYCSICRKTAGGGGYAINLGAENSTLKVGGKENLTMYRAVLSDQASGTRIGRARRYFCRVCGSALWLWDPSWPELIHPFASAIDTELPVPPEHTHMMLDSKASWVELRQAENDRLFEAYPEESIAEWHRRLGLEDPDI